MSYKEHKHPTARENVERLMENMGLDHNVSEVSLLFPNLLGLVKPGRFLVAREEVDWRMKEGDQQFEPRHIFLFNDFLLISKGPDHQLVGFHRLEHCVSQAKEKQELEVFDSNMGARQIWRCSSPHQCQALLRAISFAIAVTKSKFRIAKEQMIKMLAGTKRTQSVSLDSEELKKEFLEIEKSRTRSGWDLK